MMFDPVLPDIVCVLSLVSYMAFVLLNAQNIQNLLMITV